MPKDTTAADRKRPQETTAAPPAPQTEPQTTFGQHLAILFDEALHYAALTRQDVLSPSDEARLSDLRAASKERLAQRADWALTQFRRELAR